MSRPLIGVTTSEVRLARHAKPLPEADPPQPDQPLLRGLPPHEAFRWGIACGTAALLSEGTDLCRRADAERLLTQVQATRVA